MRKALNRAAFALVLALLSALATVPVFTLAMDRSLGNARATLRLATASLAGHLERYEALPALVADRDELVDVLLDPDDPGRRRVANLYLADLARRLSVSDAYVMLPSGETIAASNHDAISFIGQNFRYRPYFQTAAEGGQGRFFGLGTTSDKRGYYFSDPVRADGRVIGILAFKIDLDPIEASWTSSDTEILVVDPENIVFMAGRPEWRFHVFGAAEDGAMMRSALIRRYAGATVRPLDVRPSRAFDASPTLHVGTGEGAREFQALRETMPAAGWTVLVLADTAPALRQAVTAGLALFLLLALAAFLASAARSRRRRLRERANAEALVKERLEGEVEERTRALALANRQLEDEIGERRAAEESLRRTQTHLVEAGKLAALGQMSAALSHEFNQPLAAASAYTDNAALLLERGSADEARETIGRVAALLERLSAISRRLRNFARQPEEILVAVDLGEAVEEALGILGPRLEKAGATVEVSPSLPGVTVEAVALRLSQVLVNLLANAADAVEHRPVRRIRIDHERGADGSVSLRVEDSGPGVPEAIAGRIFDPFFTTKAVGQGLGLGLSISFNIIGDFGGRLRVENAPAGGAHFVVDLPAPRQELRSAAE